MTAVQAEARQHIKVPIHSAFYRWAQPQLADRLVLDAGSGEAYGSAILAESARQVVGIDHKPEVVAESRRRYRRDNLTFCCMDCQSMGFEAASFDAVVCNALFEYLPDHRAFLDEAYRVLKPGGLVICSTKNFALSLKRDSTQPLYPDHLQEFTAERLASELDRRFDQVRLFGEHMTDRSARFIMDKRALGVEKLLVGLNVKHLIPLAWRTRVRQLLTGVDVDTIQTDDFVFMPENTEAAFYIVGFAQKPA